MKAFIIIDFDSPFSNVFTIYELIYVTLFLIRFLRIVLRNYVAQHAIEAAEGGSYEEVPHLVSSI